MALPNYTIDFEKMIKQLLGYLLRVVKRVAWLKACLKPLQTIHTTFLNYTQAVVNEIKWNGQTIKLEQLLIQKFGAGITITTNTVLIDGLFVADAIDVRSIIGAELKEGALIYDGIVSIAQFNFTVYVPISITFSQTEMIAFIEKYKMFGVTYNIVIV